MEISHHRKSMLNRSPNCDPNRNPWVIVSVRVRARAKARARVRVTVRADDMARAGLSC